MLTHLGGQIVVHDIFEINLIEVVSPRVQDGEALVLDALVPVLHDVLLDEIELSLIGGDGIGKVVLVDVLFGISNKGSDGLDARLGLKIL